MINSNIRSIKKAFFEEIANLKKKNGINNKRNKEEEGEDNKARALKKNNVNMLKKINFSVF